MPRKRSMIGVTVTKDFVEDERTFSELCEKYNFDKQKVIRSLIRAWNIKTLERFGGNGSIVDDVKDLI